MSSKKSFLFAITLLFLVLTVLVLLDDVSEQGARAPEVYLPKVSTFLVMPNDHLGVIETFSEVLPRWEVKLKAQVRGRVLDIPSQSLAGRHVDKGDLLATIENPLYLSEVHEAQQRLAEAKIELLQEKKKSQQAENNWRRSGIGGRPSSLALNKPQLDLAKSRVQAANSHLISTKKNIEHLSVRAPFSGFITQRYISPGQVINEGDVLLDIIGDQKYDMRLLLSERQWMQISKNWQPGEVSLHAVSGEYLGTASIVRGGDFIDPETRLYPVFVTVNSTNTVVRAGDFVRVRLPSVVAQKSLKIPVASVTRDGGVWFVDDDGRLQRFQAEVLFYDNNWVIIRQPDHGSHQNQNDQSWNVAVTPLASFLVGNPVRPIAVDDKVEK